MLQNIEFIKNEQIPLMENPGPVRDLVVSGSIYGYRRATKSGMEPITVLNLRKALDKGYLHYDITAAIMYMLTYM